MSGFAAILLTVVIVAYGILIVWGFIEVASEVGFWWAVGFTIGLAVLILVAAGISANVTKLSQRATGALAFYSLVGGLGLAAFTAIARARDFDFSEGPMRLAGVLEVIGLISSIIGLITALT